VNLLRSEYLVRTPLLLFIVALFSAIAPAAQWVPLGPDGGDARSLASDPHDRDHIFLGTSTGTIFQSGDAGKSWTRFTHLGNRDEYVIDHIVVDARDSRRIYVAAWSLASHWSGDLFQTHDAGKRWEKIPAMHGKSIRAIAVAESDPKVIVLGALDGVFRTGDGGQHWQKLSRGHAEIKNVESIAIDPRDTHIIYAGTWHLAWKTTDGGASWRRVQDGIIEDSDVFSIVVDESNSQTVFASACSGIYKSVDGGHRFQRMENIPFSARRTRVLKQDPNDPAAVYAGTTEGLWLTRDSGATWKRVTSPEVVVNDVLIDPRNSRRVLLATDRGGVLASDDGQLNFLSSNSGFTHRYISSILIDKDDLDRIYVGVVNDRELGGVFVSNDAGRDWVQRSSGLDGRDVFALKQANDGSVLAGTNRGVFALTREASEWIPLGATIGKSTIKPGQDRESASLASAKISDIEITPKTWFAASSAGLYISSDQGKTWSRERALGNLYLVSVRVQRHMIVVASPRKLLACADSCNEWKVLRGIPADVKSIQALAITPDERIIIGSRDGAFCSRRVGARWDRMQLGLPGHNINGLTYDHRNQRLLATTADNTSIFESRDGGHTWHRHSDTGYLLRQLSLVHGRLFAATRFEGVLQSSLPF
jgi:photosystem II stability/assembly factor-like uncharacterized protein